MTVEILANEDKSIVLEEPIVVVCAADDKYAMPLAVVARSALENLKSDRKMILFVIDGGITTFNKRKILQSLDSSRCEVTFIPKPDYWIGTIEEVFRYLRAESTPESRHILSASGAAYYRLFISELLPDQFDRAIYLDCDLAVKGDLSQLWETDFGNNYVLAVQDIWAPYISSPLTGLLNYKELGIPADSKYFNSGVIVINLKKWRTDGIAAKAIEYLKCNGKYVHLHGEAVLNALLDQGVLNALLAGQWGELDPRWNLTPAIIDLYSSWQNSPFSEAVYNRLIHEPYIIHFATDRKPWNSRHTLFKDAFFDYVDMTAWSGWRLTPWRRFWLKLTGEFQHAIKRISRQSFHKGS